MRQSCSESLVLTSPCGQDMIPRTARRILTTTKPGTSILWQALHMAMPLWMTHTTNTRHVSYIAASQSVLVCNVLSCSFCTDILLYLKQEWSRSVQKGFVGAITCIQDLLDFYAWYAQRMSNTGSGAKTVSRSWEHISLLGYFHGYIKASEWQRGRYIPDEAMHGITFRTSPGRQTLTPRRWHRQLMMGTRLQTGSIWRTMRWQKSQLCGTASLQMTASCITVLAVLAHKP